MKRQKSIPTQENRMGKHIQKSTIEPHLDALFAQCSDAMGVHEAIHAIFKATCYHAKYVLTVDMAGVFDNLNPDSLIMLMPDAYKSWVRGWLEKEHVEKGCATKNDSPQGKIISPQLTNIVLNAMERELLETLTVCNSKIGVNSPVIVRYADDWVMIHEDNSIIEMAQTWIKAWMAKKALSFLAEQAQIVTTYQGFYFQGWHIKFQKNNQIKGMYKKQLQSKYSKEGGLKTEKEIQTDKSKLEKTHLLRITPNPKNIQKHKDSLKQVFEQMKAASQERLIRRLNPIIREWANYHRYINSSQAFSGLQAFLGNKLYKWATRRHPMKSWAWVQNRYWKTVNQSHRVFGYQDKATNQIVTLNTYFQK